MAQLRLRLRAIALALGLALTLAIPASALAASATSSAAETLAVPFSTTLTGVPATIDFGTSIGGSTLTSTAFTMVVGTNDAAGLNIAWQPTALASGANSIPATAHRLSGAWTTTGLGNAAGQCGLTLSSGTLLQYQTAPGVAFLSGVQNICGPSVAQAAITFTSTVVSLVVPGAQAPGSYTGTITFYANEK